MIKIEKTGYPIPNILITKGVAETQKLKVAFDSNPSSYKASSPDDPLKKFKFDPDIYGHSSVKEALIKTHNKKCCFCESKMRHVSDGDVEHFRPKGRWKQKNGQSLNYPGYYWLAYDWDNLFLACQRCNQREKQDLFPLGNNSNRAVNHNIDIKNENPLFVNPGSDDPETHIYFRGPYISHYDRIGETTIKEIALDRNDLDERREELLDQLLDFERLYLAFKGKSDEQVVREHFFKTLRRHTSGKGEYTNMIKCNFGKYTSEL